MSIRSRSRAIGLACAAVAVIALPSAALGAQGTDSGASVPKPAASGVHHYRVVITNLTKGQPLSPPVIATHFGQGEIFKAGATANWGVQQIAENGNSDPLFDGIKADQDAGFVTGLVRSTVPLVPAGRPGAASFPKSVTLTIAGKPGQRISYISMLGCTNDGFAGINAGRLPKSKGRTVNIPVYDYDAGTEENTEDFENLTGGCQAAIGVKSNFGAVGTNVTDWQLAENETIQRHDGVQNVSDDGLQSKVHGWKKGKVASFSVTQID